MPNSGGTPRITLPDELWQLVLQCPVTFPSEVFHGVMLNLVKNPNITSSHLFRADIFYDSEPDHLFQPDDPDPHHGLAKHLKEELRPLPARWPGFQLERTIVRQLVPRNPQLDKPLVQTCHFFKGQDDQGEEHSLVLYIPHVAQPEDIPFYHPAVSQLAFLHSWHPTPTPTGTLTLLYHPFPTHPTLTPKLHRTALKLLQTLHKHGQGQLLGYEKRVHHDVLIPQKSYQDTYSRLKSKYGKRLSEQWVEVTDPGKHVFEDIAIAAFLIELWRGMYRIPNTTSSNIDDDGEDQEGGGKPPFPGFIDIGCGNGLLVSILLGEDYPGSGFDARHRKTWSILPPDVQAKLEQKILVPKILQDTVVTTSTIEEEKQKEDWHDGIFGEKGPFIISNHADELTPWTPLLAYLNHSSFIAIPCCSHDLSGARFRAPGVSKGVKQLEGRGRLPQQQQQHHQQENEKNGHHPQAAETGSLARTPAQKKMPSAYSTLCSYVASLASEVGFDPEQEILRIPSTRNTCIVGRRQNWEGNLTREEREAQVIDVVERELKRCIGNVASDWIAQAQRLMKKPGSGH
ncbi:hypothetical protein M409DRAFT_63066 [Zasmidium cellare ATCC 36951]|uniref:tRNA (uracil-O(2)-)-methyltransferase n=1 Tax=Zasmidium cellare ATCC 36951 TaxID=1080233 RepID=A0A6A6D1M8_ZASCE|nr:uncharacterized protein M409DRAFT_63066 [Zasmidium cellare ATCC 36951]KAF2172350.1 hypothetical protein M409DRAFT_63066 [Zasmidium cellare ATCC 36951]